MAVPIAVRLPLLLTGKPCRSPEPRFGSPRASSSCLASDALSVPGRKRSCGQDVVGVPHEGDAERWAEEDEIVVGALDIGKPGRG
jgi:hypothetical protein